MNTKTPEYTLRAIKNYLQSDKGKAARKRYREKYKKEISKYQKEYGVKRRQKCKKLGLCYSCNKPNLDKDKFVHCADCRRRYQEWKIRKMNRKKA